jgi:hypothetical protein
MADKRSTNKAILIVFGVIALVVVIIAIASLSTDKSNQATRDADAAAAQTAATKAIADKLEITSQSIKSAGGGKTDYWFSVKNTSDKALKGQVDISVYAGERNLSTLSGVFDDVSIEPGLATSLKVTADSGADSFSYSIEKIDYSTKKPLTTE